ncbi:MULTISPECIES: hypothetical protein [Rhizobium]|uniref:Uncharacterized protein n=1 Tax=Rhizobium binae TaxID=1138190 RepID=A0ABV2ML61_9HYPH|nr:MULTISPECIES: hypothetical protein [Rhizobium]NKL49664.1 hypothetical protein [Rhizobium leguminosarum bv. viciae]MBX4936994.1 hypothetical protein [Rhizobium binae]MBX4943644.1 hypothetical protein [Rhizobium binae]MBX4979088.1 hypothetical protein [Rhizobium binae]MBX4995825.1 hypothetical protein [Rhizobium binae]
MIQGFFFADELEPWRAKQNGARGAASLGVMFHPNTATGIRSTSGCGTSCSNDRKDLKHAK